METSKTYPPRGEFDETMGEISGFGGQYEAVCRAMLKAGVKWIDENPNADPRFQGYEGVYGILLENNDDAKSLSKAVVDASGGDCTGAMHQAVISHVFAIKRRGWEYYVDKMREHDDDA